MEKEKRQQGFNVVNFMRQDVPYVQEDTKTRYNWVPVDIFEQDDFFEILTEAYNSSTTNAACVDGVADLIYGKGITTDDEMFELELARLIPAEELRRVSFDMKLYGNSAFQIVWNKEHTKIKKFYHVPVQTLRAKKLVGINKIESYFYCPDWNDVKKQKDKIEIPAFGTSTEEREILFIKEYEPNRYYYS